MSGATTLQREVRMPKNIVISAEVEVWTSREADSSDSWDRGDTDGYVSNVWASYTDDPARYWSDSIVIEEPENFNGTLYAVVADYSSGDTFGRDGGHAQVLDAFADEEMAKALSFTALEHKKQDWRVGYDYNFNFGDREYHRSWAGYFEHLNSLDIWEIKVRDFAVDPFRDKEEYYEENYKEDYPEVRFGHKVGR
jgi:hypothetical protein